MPGSLDLFGLAAAWSKEYKQRGQSTLQREGSGSSQRMKARLTAGKRDL